MSAVDKYLSKSILKIFSYNVVSTLVKMLTGFISIKVVALLVGPLGLVMLGQLNNFNAIVLSLASGGISNGITKYIAEFRGKGNAVTRFLSNAFYITVFFSLTCGILLWIFSKEISTRILLDPNYSYVFIVFAITIIFYSINNMLISILNGLKEFKKYVIVGIGNSIAGLVFTVLFVKAYGIHGVLISAVTFQSVTLILTVYLLKNSSWLSLKSFSSPPDWPVIKKYLRYTIMSFTTAATVPVSQLIIRSYIVKTLSVDQAGLWEGMNRISTMYLMVLTSSFSVYYLPRLSEITNKKVMQKEILLAYRTIIPPLILLFVGIYLFRGPLIHLLFSPEFSEMEDLFVWQLAGDVFKICTWLIGFLLIAKSMIGYFIFTELVFTLLLIGFSFFLIPVAGITGATQAYMATYMVAFGMIIIIFKKVMGSWSTN